MCLLNCTGLFPKECKTWVLYGNYASKTNNFVSFKTFWENAVQIVAFTAVPASQHGYGVAATNDSALMQSLTDAVSNFGTAYAATQELLRSNTANSNSHDAHVVDAIMASSVVATMAVVMVAAMVAAAATTVAAVATSMAAMVAIQMALVVATRAATVAAMVAAMSATRLQAAPPPCWLNDWKTVTTAFCLAVTWTTSTPA
jgi:hypothetical protein